MSGRDFPDRTALLAEAASASTYVANSYLKRLETAILGGKYTTSVPVVRPAAAVSTLITPGNVWANSAYVQIVAASDIATDSIIAAALVWEAQGNATQEVELELAQGVTPTSIGSLPPLRFENMTVAGYISVTPLNLPIPLFVPANARVMGRARSSSAGAGNINVKLMLYPLPL